MSFHVDIGFVRILPASFGCLILYDGLTKLEAASDEKMGKPLGLALLLAVIYVTFWFWEPSWYWSGPVTLGLMSLLEMLLFSGLFFWSGDVLKIQGQHDEGERIAGRGRGYVVVFSLLTAGLVFVSTFHMERTAVVMAFLALAARIWVMMTVSGLKELYAEGEGPTER